MASHDRTNVSFNDGLERKLIVRTLVQRLSMNFQRSYTSSVYFVLFEYKLSEKGLLICKVSVWVYDKPFTAISL
jgi:hypothetical protein